MSFGNLLKNIGKGLGNLQKQNRDNPNEQTAHGSIFDKIKDALEDMKEKAASTNPGTEKYGNADAPVRESVEPLDMLKKKIEEVKMQNEADPEVTTAEESVFERMKKMIEEQAKAEAQAETTTPTDSGSWSAPEPTAPATSNAEAPVFDRFGVGNYAMTNSMGGSLAIRQNPDFGAPTNSIRIPESSKVKLLEYSEHTVNIDGHDSRWAKVDFDGTVGWILETYLNFN